MSREDQTSTSRAPIGLGRAFRWGFVVGAAILIPLVVFALISPIGEDLLPFLAPGSLLLGPFADAMAGWPGWLNIGLTAVANGLVYSLIAVAVTAVLNAVRR